VRFGVQFVKGFFGILYGQLKIITAFHGSRRGDLDLPQRRHQVETHCFHAGAERADFVQSVDHDLAAEIPAADQFDGSGDLNDTFGDPGDHYDGKRDAGQTEEEGDENRDESGLVGILLYSGIDNFVLFVYYRDAGDE